LVAPDYPGFGHSDAPAAKKFSYTFDNIAKVMDQFTETLNLTKYTLYMQDYGGPVGFRMALAHPDRIEALIVQDAVAHNEGLGANWKTRRAFWADHASHEAALRTNLLPLDTTRTRHVGNDPNPKKYDPDLWTDEYAFLNKPGEANIQSDLFYDYRTNVDAYPNWQTWMQKTQPRLLVLWGKYDLSFELTEPEAYRRDVPKAQVHILDAGHFALDTAADEIADLVRRFMSNSSQPRHGKRRANMSSGMWRSATSAVLLYSKVSAPDSGHHVRAAHPSRAFLSWDRPATERSGTLAISTPRRVTDPWWRTPTRSPGTRSACDV